MIPLPPNKTYELWVIPADGTAPIPAGTFQPDSHGMASVLLPNLPAGIQAKAFGVTMENAGGATTPTLPILLTGG
jgi:anti-sigma-K factor RskA